MPRHLGCDNLTVRESETGTDKTYIEKKEKALLEIKIKYKDVKGK